ncbi:hypothetical protein Y032_0312g2167 [Ancylostoma ceylanicum]|uniref:Uncharacterized protein n=1 Tax=Ancylostoma ceylanicum TaxID=53326 RepID=A0A016S2E2_9BILA|nr:hypothetical protein Y032_0312g2167 [Ancylostoma ceylanicum]
MTSNMHEFETTQVYDKDLRRTNYFEYQDSELSVDGNLAHEVVVRDKSTWLKWRSMTGKLCDKQIRISSKRRFEQLFVLSHCIMQIDGSPPNNWSIVSV